MAIVVDKADPLRRIDKPYMSANRIIATTPVGTLVPMYTNELVNDNVAQVWYRATKPTSDGWVTVGGPGNA